MADHKVIYAKCPYCKAEQPWARHAASEEFSSGRETTVCASCGGKMIITATMIMRFTAKKFGEGKA